MTTNDNAPTWRELLNAETPSPPRRERRNEPRSHRIRAAAGRRAAQRSANPLRAALDMLEATNSTAVHRPALVGDLAAGVAETRSQLVRALRDLAQLLELRWKQAEPPPRAVRPALTVVDTLAAAANAPGATALGRVDQEVPLLGG